MCRFACHIPSFLNKNHVSLCQYHVVSIPCIRVNASNLTSSFKNLAANCWIAEFNIKGPQKIQVRDWGWLYATKIECVVMPSIMKDDFY